MSDCICNKEGCSYCSLSKKIEEIKGVVDAESIMFLTCYKQFLGECIKHDKIRRELIISGDVKKTTIAALRSVADKLEKNSNLYILHLELPEEDDNVISSIHVIASIPLGG
jgi:hypothetical protein